MREKPTVKTARILISQHGFSKGKLVYVTFEHKDGSILALNAEDKEDWNNYSFPKETYEIVKS